MPSSPPARDPLEVAELLSGLSELVDFSEAHIGGLPALQLTVELAEQATAAMGATFVEYTRSGGRVVVATQELSWALGRPVDILDAGWTAGPRVREIPLDSLSGSDQLRGRGVNRVLHAVAVADNRAAGSLQVHFADAGAQPDPGQLAALRLLASMAGHLYRESAGLPVYPDGPALSPLAQGMAVIGPDTAVRSWSPTAVQLTGRSFEETVGRPLPFPTPRNGEVLVYRLDETRWIRARGTPLSGNGGMVVTFRLTSVPESADQSRDLFLAVTSHELRTPVTVIRGFADTLTERWDALDDSARREAVFVMAQRARDLGQLVDRLLNAASDVALLDPRGAEPFDLVAALSQAADDLNPELRRGLRVQLPDGLPAVLGDPASMAIVLTELVTNACKYSPERVEVELTAGADEHTAWFRVSDRGLGIPVQHSERAFDRFWQHDSGDQRRYGGVGLGLYLVRRIVERRHGWVSLRPRDGGGTVAEVRLPRATAGVPPQHVPLPRHNA